VSTIGGTPLAYSQLQERVHATWRMVLRHTTRTHYTFIGNIAQTYRFRVRAGNVAGQFCNWSLSSLSGSATPHA
jgi:hypothetical protein